MGFTPQQARQALARTDTGTDVEAALELLVGNGNAPHGADDQDERLARKLHAREQKQAQSQAAPFHDSYDDDFDPKEVARQIKQHGQKDQPEQRQRQRSNNEARRGAAGTDNEGGADWQQQADQLYAQASEIGTSVFNKASAFWSTAKAQAQKALDEHNRAGAERSSTPSDAGSDRHRARRWGASSAAPKNKEWEGKPKWMIEAEQAEANEANGTGSHASQLKQSADGPAEVGGFKDSDNEDEAIAPEPPTRAPRRPAAPASAAAASGVAAAASAMSSVASSLFGGGKAEDAGRNLSRQQSPSQPPPSVPARSAAAAPKAPYASPNRRGTPARSAAPSPIPPKAPLKRRPIPSDASHSISSANRNKEEGNEHFKRGAYGDAETSYTRGISALESSSSSESIRLVPLFSNRANVRLKNGDAPGTVADCDQLLSIVLSLFGGSQRDANGRIAVYRASQEAPLPAEIADINLRETYGKALVRRAQALEAAERWKLAKADWEVLLEYEKAEGSGVKTGASNMKFAREGLHRCGKMLGEKVVGPAVSSTGPPARTNNARAPTRSRTTPAAAGEKASAAFANQQQQQAAEETEKFALKDSVDARIEAWKRGKETNLRALLSSLDTIVWPELGWKPIALHQVLDQAGLKKNYTKAIARLHPDKIRKDATTEQKMIASAAFHAINEAWNAQQ
uniref:UBA domain-containing protein n=2 Tax=Kalmanozyma brasiliensis (strain GHG001) TaxID=1365824 RepID=V5GQN6_KALBG